MLHSDARASSRRLASLLLAAIAMVASFSLLAFSSPAGAAPATVGADSCPAEGPPGPPPEMPRERAAVEEVEPAAEPEEVGPEARQKEALDLCQAASGALARGERDRAIQLIDQAYQRLLETVNAMLDYDKNIEIWIEPKPNEPTDQAYVPTIGHPLTLSYASKDHKRVKGLIESAHAMLAGLDASDEMAFALAHDKLASVHLNDQNGLKYDQDKNFGGANLRAAFNQVRVLEESGYGNRGEFIGLDVKAIRTQRGCPVTDHLKNSRELFLALVQKVRTVDQKLVQQYRDARDYEALELYILKHIMGLK